MKSPQSFIFIGRSGCGKGTQAKLLMEHLKQNDPERDVLYVQTGGEFREFCQGDTHTQNLAKVILEKGGLLPEFMAIYFWANKMVKDMKPNQHVVFDGTPRKYHEAVVLDSIFDYYSLSRPHIVYLNVSEDWSRSRLMSRQRVDDNNKEIEVRLGWFKANVLPAIEYYQKNPLYKFHDIDGERSVAEIHAEIRALLA